MISRSMMNRQMYANGPGITGIKTPFEQPQSTALPEQIVQEAINRLVSEFRVPVNTAFKAVVATLTESGSGALEKGGVEFLVNQAAQKIKTNQLGNVGGIEDVLRGASPTEDDTEVMQDLQMKYEANPEDYGYVNEEDEYEENQMADGGIMQLRQNYGLGSIVKKAVKGVTKAVKKVVSSDIGKLALLAAGGYYLGGGTFGGMFKPFSKTALGSSPFGQAIANPFVKAGQFLQSPSSFFTKRQTFGVDYGGKSLAKTPIKDLIQ